MSAGPRRNRLRKFLDSQEENHMTQKDLSAELEAANRRIAELEQAPYKPPTQTSRLVADLAAGQDVVVEWLTRGCPACHAPIKTDFPVYEAGLPGVYPALLFHYGVFHEGVTPPPAPHPEDDAALDKPVAKGIEPNG